MRDRVGRVGEGALLLHLAGGADEAAQRGTGERAADADSLHAGFRELIDGEGRPAQSHDNIDRFGDRRADLSDCLET